jgi:acyl transferase domain-containing protein/aryl carrier-like protein
MKKTLFIFSGEGTHSADSKFKLLEQSTLWPQIEAIVQTKLDTDLKQLWHREIGNHRCPYSPLLTVVTQICLADLWRRWGYRPDVVIGHSTGELAASYEAGLYALEDVLVLAYRIGRAASHLDGVMAHGIVSDSRQADLPVYRSSSNFTVDGGRHVTVSGDAEEVDDFLRAHPDFIRMRLPHPWHHPDYEPYAKQLPRVHSRDIEPGIFVSGVTRRFETRLADDHWRKWLTSPIDFIQSMAAVEEQCSADAVEIIEIGFHPVLEKCCTIFSDYTYASSMYRGEDDLRWIVFQRKKLDRRVFHDRLTAAVAGAHPNLDFSKPLAYQGLDSLGFVKLATALEPLFPTLAPQDFYRYKTIDQLVERFGAATPIEQTGSVQVQKNDVVISGMSCRFPAAAETLTQFWDMLQSKADQVHLETGRSDSEAGFLNASVTRFDHQYFDIPSAEARAMDPQQILALELTELLWKDAGIDPDALDKSRVGVYIGAWNQEYRGDRSSVYYPTGTNPSIIAARISYQYDLRGPSWVSNAACSSSLVAIHYAAKDIEAGRIDYAVAGGVNMLLDPAFTESMRSSGFLSKENRCKTFDDSADGYVRAEGGGLVLLANKTLVDDYYAAIAGSSVNQNGRRAQLITAPHPEAQEELIVSACQDAGIRPQEIAYVECHGTGTKIGDPIEISAIRNTVAKSRKEICYLGSVKSNIGHLESAAGIAGLIKSVSALNHGMIPPNLQFNQPNRYIDFKSTPIQVVTQATPIDPTAVIGVSSFGFGGTNAHLVIKGADAAVRKPIQPLQIPFDRDRAVPLNHYLHTAPQAAVEPDKGVDVSSPTVEAPLTREAIDKLVGQLFFELTNVQEIDPDIELTDQGLDSMSGTELITHLETAFNIEIDPDILFEYPLRVDLVDEIFALAAGSADRTKAA